MGFSSLRSEAGRCLGTRSTLPERGPHHEQPGVSLAVGPLAGGRVEEGGAQGEHVGGGRHRLAPGLLGRHEPGGAHHHARHREAVGLVTREGDPEVGQAGLALVVEEHVGGLDVAVHHARPVGLGQRRQQPAGLALDLVGRGRAVLGHPLGQAAPRQVGHDQHDLVALVEHVVEAHHVAVVEAPQHVGLPQQPLAGAGDLAGRALQGEPLERHLAAVRGAGQVDRAHAAPAQPRDQLIGRAGQRARWPRAGRGVRGGTAPDAAPEGFVGCLLSGTGPKATTDVRVPIAMSDLC